jgi:hypothetical protein
MTNAGHYAEIADLRQAMSDGRRQGTAWHTSNGKGCPGVSIMDDDGGNRYKRLYKRVHLLVGCQISKYKAL